jgi:hypothetical protein
MQNRTVFAPATRVQPLNLPLPGTMAQAPLPIAGGLARIGGARIGGPPIGSTLGMPALPHGLVHPQHMGVAGPVAARRIASGVAPVAPPLQMAPVQSSSYVPSVGGFCDLGKLDWVPQSQAFGSLGKGRLLSGAGMPTPVYHGHDPALQRSLGQLRGPVAASGTIALGSAAGKPGLPRFRAEGGATPAAPQSSMLASLIRSNSGSKPP